MAHPKPLFVGEFGFHSASTIRTFLDACVDLPLAGFLIWSLRFRCEKGGFYSHHEFDRWYALHHPGFSERIEEGFGKDERELCRALEQAAGRLTKRTPILPIPEPPLLFPPEHQKGQVSLRWRGSTFASCYDLERNKSGSWKQIGPGLLRAKSVEDNVDMAHGGVTWIDKPGKGRAGYRLRASNDSGKSAWSNEVFLDL